MKKSDLILMSMGNLWRRKLRTILTLLGVVIGTVSIIIMVSLGVGMKTSIENQLKEWASLNVIDVYPQYSPRGDDRNKTYLNDEMLKTIEKIDGVTVISPVKNMSIKLRHGKFYADTILVGIKSEMLEKQSVDIKAGNIFSETSHNEFLIGERIGKYFNDPRNTNFDDMYYDYGQRFGDEGSKPKPKVDVMKDSLLLNPDSRYGQPGLSHDEKLKIPRPIKIKVSGVIKEGNFQFDNSVYTNLETFNKIQDDFEKWQIKNQDPDSDYKIEKKDKRKQQYDDVKVYVEDMEKVELVEKEIKKLGFETNSMISMLEDANGFANIAQLVLGGIGAVSLLVAAIGISNTMVMSIYERTKEIGVMKVIGASLEDIQGMFLAEAALIGLIGGVIGLIVSTGGSMLINFVTRNANIFGGGPGGASTSLSVIPIWLYILGISFTTFVGLISGYLPARRAMKLSVLKALRNE